MIEKLLKHHHLVLVLGAVIAMAGLIGFHALPLNLFPETNRPRISVVTQWFGAAADDVATEVTHPMEVRLSAIDGVRRVTSTSRDQVSAVMVEFEYGIDVDTAATDVANELPRVRGVLPEGVKDPLIFKITEAAQPVVVLAVTPADGTDLDLSQVRRIAENQLRDILLGIPNVAEAEVFGGHIRQVSVDIDRDRLIAHNLTMSQVASALAGSNISVPAGLVHREGKRLLLTAQNLAHVPEDLEQVLVPLPGGNHVRVGDLGTVHWGEVEATALYRGNGKESVAVSLLRGEKGNASEVLESVEQALPGVRAQFPMLDIAIADTQGRLIDLTVSNMLDALRDAVLMTLVVLLFFLGNTRAAVITAVSLPLSYLLTFAVMKLLGYEFDMVTLTAVIIAVGLLADDAVVVIENIERRMRQFGESGLTVAVKGTQEILLADTSGTVSTVIVLIPIMFIGGYVQTVLRPLTVTLSVALFASLIVSVSIIPLLAAWILKPNARDPLGWVLRPVSAYVVKPMKHFYVAAVEWAIQHRLLVLALLLGLFVFSVRQMPLVGRELMPLMDTGVIDVNFEAQPDTGVAEMARLSEKVGRAIRAEVPEDWLLSTSTVVGAEPAVKSFGADRTLQQGQVTVNIIDRLHRPKSIFELEKAIRARLQKIPGLLYANVSEFGATPLSSLRSTVDIMITGPDPQVLDALAADVATRLQHVPGLTGIERSWYAGSGRLRIQVDDRKARLYGVDARNVASQAAEMVGGTSGGRLRVRGENPVPVWVRLEPAQRSGAESIASLPIRVNSNALVPLSVLANTTKVTAPSAETHQALLPTIDVLGYRRNVAVTHLQERIDTAFEGLTLPRGYSISREGEIKQMNESFTRLGASLILGLALLYFMLVVTFRSFLDPFAIMGTLPLALIGAAWAMMIANKHGCLPSFMGLILLMGIVVNNGILLVDFAKVSLENGKPLPEALRDAVSLRTRPILMTAGASAVGMIPIAMEWAVGIERLSPLAVVAIGGLVAGTSLTLVAVPVLFDLIESARRSWQPADKAHAATATPGE